MLLTMTWVQLMQGAVQKKGLQMLVFDSTYRIDADVIWLWL